MGRFFEKIANMTVEAAKTHDRVVLSHATFYQPCRDVVIETLLNGGVKREQITILQLTIDKAVLHGGLFERTKRQAEQQGKTVTESCREWGWKFDGELTKEMYIEIYGKMEEDGGDAAAFPDVSSRGVAHLDGVDAAIGGPSSRWQLVLRRHMRKGLAARHKARRRGHCLRWLGG
ncbi:hypothetical protein ACHAWF_015605 [Thalassiosira exigua]